MAMSPVLRPEGRGGETRKSEKRNSTLAKGLLQTAGTLEVESRCAELAQKTHGGHGAAANPIK